MLYCLNDTGEKQPVMPPGGKAYGTGGREK